MSKNSEPTSEREDESLENRSVFDFLYNDSRRIGSFLSQFHLKEVTQTKDAERGRDNETETSGKGSLAAISGTHKRSQKTHLTATEGLIRVFDPLWSNARSFLDFLGDNNLIQRDLPNARIGQFVLCSGALSILDLQTLKEAWKLPSISAMVSASNGQTPTRAATRNQRRSQGNQKPDSASSTTQMTLEFLSILPHSVQATIFSGSETIWSLLNEEFMVTSASEIAISHGAALPGDWIMLGILSGHPDFGSIEYQQKIAQIGSDLEAGLVKSVIGQISQNLSPLIRQVLGRPVSAYGVTPLLIFREVA